MNTKELTIIQNAMFTPVNDTKINRPDENVSRCQIATKTFAHLPLLQSTDKCNYRSKNAIHINMSPMSKGCWLSDIHCIHKWVHTTDTSNNKHCQTQWWWFALTGSKWPFWSFEIAEARAMSMLVVVYVRGVRKTALNPKTMFWFQRCECIELNQTHSFHIETYWNAYWMIFYGRQISLKIIDIFTFTRLTSSFKHPIPFQPIDEQKPVQLHP